MSASSDTSGWPENETGDVPDRQIVAESVERSAEDSEWTEEMLARAYDEVKELSELVEGELRREMEALQNATAKSDEETLPQPQVRTIIRRFVQRMLRLVLQAAAFVETMDLPPSVKRELLTDLQTIRRIMREEASSETLHALSTAAEGSIRDVFEQWHSDDKEQTESLSDKDLMTMLMNRAKQVMSTNIASALTDVRVLQRRASEGREQRENSHVPRQVLRISLEDMIDAAGGEIRREEKDGRTYVSVRSSKGSWTAFELPPGDVLYKGGLPRLLLKLVLGTMTAGEAAQRARTWESFHESGASIRLQGSERVHPDIIEKDRKQNDIDVITLLEGNGTAPIPLSLVKQAKDLGADPDGVEFIPRGAMDDDAVMVKVFAGRDGNGNECVLTQDGLVVSNRAIEAMYSGIFEVNQANKEFYGAETFFYGGTMLQTARGEMRGLKFVSEGKFRGLRWCPINRFIDPGIYWLVLFDKFNKKENRAELFHRLLFLGKKMGIVGQQETLKDVLDRTHEECPYFDVVNRGQMTERKLLLWFAGKVTRMTSRKAKRALRHTTYQPERSPGDTEMQTITIDDIPSLREAERQDIERSVAEFLTEADARTAEYKRLHEADKSEFQAALESRRREKTHREQRARLEASIETMRTECIALHTTYEEAAFARHDWSAMETLMRLRTTVHTFALQTGQLPFEGAERYLPYTDNEEKLIPSITLDPDDEDEDEEDNADAREVVTHSGNDLDDK